MNQGHIAKLSRTNQRINPKHSECTFHWTVINYQMVKQYICNEANIRMAPCRIVKMLSAPPTHDSVYVHAYVYTLVSLLSYTENYT